MNKYRFRVQLLGNSGAGKLALVERLTRNYFLAGEKPPSRLGHDIQMKSFVVNEEEVELELWDNHYTIKYSYPPGQFLRRRSFFSHGFNIFICLDLIQSLFPYKIVS